MTELQEQLAQSRGGFTTQEKYAVKELMVLVDAVTAAHHNKFFEKNPHVPKKFTEALDEYEYNPSVRGDAQLNLLFSYITEMQIGPYLKFKLRHWLEYVYGTEYFDKLIEEVLEVYADPRLNKEYFCTVIQASRTLHVISNLIQLTGNGASRMNLMVQVTSRACCGN